MRAFDLLVNNSMRWSAFMAVILFGLLLAVTTHAVEYGQLGAKPGNPDPDVENSDTWFIYAIDPGTSIQDNVVLSNNSDEPVDALVYAADTVRSSSGGFAFRQYTEPKEEVGLWVRFYPEEIPEQYKSLFEKNNGDIIATCGFTASEQNNRQDTEDEDAQDDEENSDEQDAEEKSEQEEDLDEETSESDAMEAGSTDTAALDEWCKGVEAIEKTFEPKDAFSVPFIFSVPEGADVGEHTGAIAIQKKFAEKTEGDSGVRLTTRLGVRIYETVPGEIVRDLSLEEFAVTPTYNAYDVLSLFGEGKKDPTYTVTTVVRNNGNVSIEHNNDILIQDGGGETQREERIFQALKGDEFTANYQWIAPGNGSFAFTPEIRYEDSEGNEKVLTAETIKVSVMPTREIILGVAALAVIALVIFIVWLVRKKKYGGQGWVEHEVQTGENITMLAQTYGIDWKVLAKTNHIKAPYFLTPGDIITVPQTGGSTTASKQAKTPKKAQDKQPQEQTKKVASGESPFEEDMQTASDMMGGENEAEEEAVNRAKEKTSIAALAMEMQMKHADKGDNLAFSDQKKQMDVSWMKEDEKQYEADVQPEKKRRKALMWQFVIWSIVVIGIVALALNLLSRMDLQKDQQPVSITNVAQEEKPAEVAEDVMDNDGSADDTSSDAMTDEDQDEAAEVIAPKEITVTVLNGGAAAGTAGSLTRAIGADEYDTQTATNAKESIEGNVVYYGADEYKQAAEDIAAILTKEKFTPVEVKEDAEIIESVDSKVVVIIGA